MTIKEVVLKFGITDHTLRYYEKIGLIDPVKKNGSGKREYSENDLSRIEFIVCMRKAGLSIETLKRYVLLRDDDNTIDERKNILLEERGKLQSKIEEMEQTLARLDYKIEIYDEMLSKRV